MHKKTHFKTIENMLLKSPHLENQEDQDKLSTVMEALNAPNDQGDLKRLDMIQMNVNEKELLKQVLKKCNYNKDKKLPKISSQPSLNDSAPSSPRFNIEAVATQSVTTINNGPKNKLKSPIIKAKQPVTNSMLAYLENTPSVENYSSVR